ncbi:MAG: hypothetical protein VYC34_06520 [Planctomycetota bacterium]|nr:hypothetical protein [Planctomycetota bacterium]
MNDALLYLATDNPIGMIAVAGAFAIPIVAIIAGVASSTSSSRDKERSRREIAAYVAEGSMTPEEGERLLNAGEKVGRRSC